MRRAATIVGVIGGLLALILGGADLSLRADETGIGYTLYSICAFSLLPLGVIAIVGAFLGGRRRAASLWLLAVTGALMLVVSIVFYVVVWREPAMSLAAANVGLLAPGVVTILAAVFRFLGKAKPEAALSAGPGV